MRRFLTTLGWLLKIALVLGIGFLLYLYPGTLQIDWQGTTLQTSTAFAGIVTVIAVLIFATLYHYWRRLISLPQHWRRKRRVKSLELGYGALNKGLLSVAAGDSINANKNAKKALNILPDLALSHLLAAQAAQLRGDDVEADVHLAILAQHPEGQLFGLRGQLSRALQRQDRTEALRLARLAYQQQPHQPWIIDTAVQMEARNGHWLQVEKILRNAIHLGSPEAAKWQQDLSAALAALSDQAKGKADTDAALDCAREAGKLHLGWTPAVTRLADLWRQKAYRRRAQKAVLGAWERSPHPELVAAWLQISGAEKSLDRTAVTEKLIAHNADNADAAMAMARATYTANLWGVARQHALRAIDYRPDRAAYRLMADIEQADTGQANKVRAWLDKAAEAPPEPQWQCVVTGEIFPHWQPLNRQQDFNTIQWQTPFTTRPVEQKNILTGF